MNTQKIWQSLLMLDTPYAHLVNDVMNNFAQEVIDREGFDNNDPNNTSIEDTISTLRDTLNTKRALEFENCALEFCITNEYMIEGESWNCVKHWIDRYNKQFNKNELEYLRELNKSYVSVYKVISVTSGVSIDLENMLETNKPSVKIVHKTLSKKLERELAKKV